MSSKRLGSLWRQTAESTRIPPDIVEDFNQWKLDSSSLIMAMSTPPIPSQDRSRNRERITSRFITTAYYDISSRLENKNTLITAFAASVSEALPQGEVTKEEVWSWIAEGRRWRCLANGLFGTACFFFLPENIADKT